MKEIDMQVLTIIFSILGSVVSGIALFYLQRWFRKKDSRDEQADKANAQK